VLRTVVHDTTHGLHLTSEARTVIEDVHVTSTSGVGIAIRTGVNPLVRKRGSSRCGARRRGDQGRQGRLEDCLIQRPGDTGACMADDGNVCVGGGAVEAPRAPGSPSAAPAP
jgi:hypothetical protein